MIAQSPCVVNPKSDILNEREQQHRTSKQAPYNGCRDSDQKNKILNGLVKNSNNKKERNHMPRHKVYSPEFKAEIVIEILRETSTISEVGARESISPKLLGNWKREFLENAYRAFSVTKDEKIAKMVAKEAEDREQELLAKIGGLTYELDWLKKKSEPIFGRRKAVNA